MRVTVVVPTFNEAGNIETLVSAVRQVLPRASILVVDDGSPDGTADLADALGAALGNVEVVRRTSKDALPALVAVVEHGADLAVGSRYVPGGITLNWPRRRRTVSRWGNRYAAGVLGLAVNDVTAGYRAYRSTALERMKFDSVQAEGYGFQIEMTYRLVRLGGRIVEFPITFRDRMAGESKFSGSIIREAFGLVLRLWAADFGGRRRRRAMGG
jgi:glycosyltransferase involved in cell wall biosynthesis